MTHAPKRINLPSAMRGKEHEHLEALFDALPDAAREEIGQIARYRTLSRGEVLVSDGDILQDVGYVLSGTLGMTKTLPDGRTHIVGLLVPTDMYGHLFNGPISFRIEALTETKLFCFDRERFEDILRRHPDVERLFLIEILDELDAAREWIILMGARKAIERVASFLLILCHRKLRHRNGRHSPGHTIPINLLIRRSDLAHYLGTRPETLSRALHQLADLGVVRLLDPYRLEVLDLSGLSALSGEGTMGDVSKKS